MPSQAAAASAARTRSIAYVALSIALMAVGAWVTVPLGPVPFTLQIFVFTFVLIALEPRLALASALGYVVIGAIGVPVFSSMRGGIGVLAGPTGGFIWGYVLGYLAAFGIAFPLKKLGGAKTDGKATGAAAVRAFAMAFVFLACTYICGWFQLMVAMGLTPEAAFAAGVAPFIVVDIVKIVAAVFVALAVKRALEVAR